MKIVLGVAVALCAVVSLPPAHVQAALTSGFVASATEQISAGVVYQAGSVQSGSNQRQADLVTLDAEIVGTSLRLNQANDVALSAANVVDQALADSVDGHRVVAAINGSLFNAVIRNNSLIGTTGLGLNVSDGYLVNAGVPRARPDGIPGFGIGADGNPFIGTPHPTMTLTLPSSTAATEVRKVNGYRFEGQVALYTPGFGPSTQTDPGGDEFVVEGFNLPLTATGTHTGTIVEVRRGMNDTPIGPGQVVISVSSTAPDVALYSSLDVGSAVTFTMSVEEPWASATQTVGGKDLLVIDGQNVVVDPVENRARSAIGINAEGDVLLFTVDSGTTARGLNLVELADLMIERGAVAAMNLDGGNSSEMAVRRPGDVNVSFVNALGENSRRPVANSLQVVSTAPDGPLATLLISPADTRATIGGSVAFVAKGQDANLNGILFDPALVDWSVATSPGANPDAEPPPVVRTDTGIILTPMDDGEFDVNATFEGLTTTAGLSVSPDVTPPTLEVTGVGLEDAPSVALTGVGLTLTWNASDDGRVARIQVQRKVGTSRWRNLTVPDSSAGAMTTRIALNKRVKFRARAFDEAGHASPWSTTGRFRVIRVNDTDSRLKLTGGWTSVSDASALGGSFVRSSTAGAKATLTLKALQVQAIGSHGPTHGIADVYLDGTLSWSAALTSETFDLRQVLYLSPILSPAASSMVELLNAGTEVPTLLDVDAFLVLQPVS